MASTVMMERTGMGMAGMTTAMPGGQTTMPAGTNWMMIPRGTLKMEKCTGGMKIMCACEDKMACSMLQNLCTMLAGGLCSCCCTMNGMVVNCCNLTMGMCKCDMTKDGICITCVNGDSRCTEMIQGCCDCTNTMLKSGCVCCVMLNNTPIFCGCA